MAKKVERKQDIHHRKVREIARKYKRDGYTVKVEGVRGYGRPATVGAQRHRPDIEAMKSGKRVIVEVKTARSLARDKDQLKTFARSASYRSGTEFHLVVTNPRKRQAESKRSIMDRNSRIHESRCLKSIDKPSRPKEKSR